MLTEVDTPPAGVAGPRKPLWRGRLHQIAFFVSIPLGLVLVALASTAPARLAAIVYALGVSGLYGTSAAYHRGAWTPRARQWMQRLDHSMIFVLIAATYTPLCLLALDGPAAWGTLTAVWVGAVGGTVLGLTGIAQKPGVGITLYLIMGWAAVFSLPALVDALGVVLLTLIAVGGIVYTLGAVGLATRWPDPSPRVFGYHEVWHVMVVVAGLCMAVVVWDVVLAA